MKKIPSQSTCGGSTNPPPPCPSPAARGLENAGRSEEGRKPVGKSGRRASFASVPGKPFQDIPMPCPDYEVRYKRRLENTESWCSDRHVVLARRVSFEPAGYHRPRHRRNPGLREPRDRRERDPWPYGLQK